MQKVLKISRADLKNKNFKNASVENFGLEPTQRDLDLVAKILKKNKNRKGMKP